MDPSIVTPQPKRLSLRPQWRDNRLSFVASIQSSPTTPVPSASQNATPPSMSDSPLTQQNQSEATHEPKVVSLYRQLFSEEYGHEEKSAGFWRELFLLKPDLPRLRQILEVLDADWLLNNQHAPQVFVLQALDAINERIAPSDNNALDALTVFFAIVLAKKYTNPSADIIEVVAGLDDVDTVFTDLVLALDRTIRDGRDVMTKQKAVRTAIALVAGGYQSALVSYFISRDFFPALMKLVHTLDHPLQAAEPLLLTGLLANYNKFEMHNQYGVRLADFVHDQTMAKCIESIGWTSVLLRDHYVEVQNDTPVGWTLAGTLNTPLTYVGLGTLTGAKTPPMVYTEDQQKELFADQPGVQAASLLALYDFTLANSLFRRCLVTQMAPDKSHAEPFASFLSLCSYLFEHAYRSSRASLYTYMTLIILLILVEDAAIAKPLCEMTATVRLCRQRPPLLPLIQKERPYAAAVIDVLVDGINHNLRKRLDTGLYMKSIMVLTRVLAYLGKSRTKLSYHWSELWRSLLSFVRFLTSYAEDMKSLPDSEALARAVVDLLTIALSNGEAFIPDTAAYDDLFYKLVESGEALTRLRDAYYLGKGTEEHNSIGTLIGVSKHYQELIETKKGRNARLSPGEVSKIIKDGYETLNIETKEGLDHVDGYREAEHKVVLKRIARVAVADAAALVAAA